MEGMRMWLCPTEPDWDIDHARLFPQASIRAGFPLHLDCRLAYASPDANRFLRPARMAAW
jgi:hypothetical protein